jgi:hypothetical protein
VPDPTDADREAADRIALGGIIDSGYGEGDLRDRIARALADERERARAPFLALADGWADQPAETVGGRIFRHCAHEIRAAAQEAPK